MSFSKGFCVLLVAMGLPATAMAEGELAQIDTGAPAGEASVDSDPMETEETITAEETVEAEADEDAKDWAMAVVIGSTVGQGTFANVANDTEFADEVGPANNAFDRASLSYVLSPSYSLGDFSFSGEVAWVHYLTAGSTFYANEPGEVFFQDVALNAGYEGWTIPAVDINVAPSLSFGLPTSRLSRTSRLYTSASAGVSASRTFFERLTLSAGVSGSKDFHRFKQATIRQEEIGESDIIYREAGGEQLSSGLYSIGGVHTEYALAPNIAASIVVWDKLSASISYALVTYWTYNTDNEDEFTSPLADTGRGVAQLTSTGVSLAYPILSDFNGFNLAASGGIATAQTPKTADNRSFNFPFWNFNGAAKNASSLKFSLTASY